MFLNKISEVSALVRVHLITFYIFRNKNDENFKSLQYFFDVF